MIFVCGDIHGKHDIAKLTTDKWRQGATLTKKDYLIVAGDFGVLWKNKEDDEERKLKKWLELKPWTTLFIDGNHENFERLQALPREQKFNGIVGKVNDSIYYLKRGFVYTINDKKFFVMGGGDSIDKAGRVEGLSWWREELPNYKELRFGMKELQDNDNCVDFIITHSCPESIFELMGFSDIGYDSSEKFLRQYFDEIVKITTFKAWYFGHFHNEYRMDKFYGLYNETPLLVC